MENTFTNQISEEPEFAELDPIKTTQFEADGVTYYIDRTSRLSIERKTWLERFETYSLLGRDGGGLLRDVRRAYDLNNQSKPGDVGVILDNILKGIADLTQKESPVFYLCTLFVNRAGEDKGTYDLDLAKQKIEHWKKARPIIPSDFFLALGFVYLKISHETWNTIIQTYSGLPSESPTLAES